MSDAILVAMITSAVTLFGVILSNSKTAAVTNNEIKHLTEEVKKHNGLIERVYKLEEHGAVIDEQIRVANHRIDDLEQGRA